MCVHSKSAVYRFKLTRDTDGWPALDGDIEEYIPGAGAGFRDGDVQEAQFNEPRGIAIDKEGNLYIADVNNHRIRKVDTKLNIVTTIAVAGKDTKTGILWKPNSISLGVYIWTKMNFFTLQIKTTTASENLLLNN